MKIPDVYAKRIAEHCCIIPCLERFVDLHEAHHPPPPPQRWGGVSRRRYGGVLWDAPGQWRGRLPSSVWTRHGAVKHRQPGGSIGTTHRGKGRGSREVRIGQGGGGRAQGGERPMGTAAYGGRGFKGRAVVSVERQLGTASCRQQHNQAPCTPPPPFAGATFPNHRRSMGPGHPLLPCGRRD